MNESNPTMHAVSNDLNTANLKRSVHKMPTQANGNVATSSQGQDELFSWTVSTSVDTMSLLNTPRALRFSEKLVDVAKNSPVWRFPRAAASTPVFTSDVEMESPNYEGKRTSSENYDEMDIYSIHSPTPPTKRPRRKRTLRRASRMDTDESAMDQDDMIRAMTPSDRRSFQDMTDCDMISMQTNGELSQNDLYDFLMNSDHPRETSRQSSECSDFTTGSSPACEEGTQAKATRRRKLRSQGVVVPPHANVSSELADGAMAIDEDDSATFQPSTASKRHVSRHDMAPVVLGAPSSAKQSRSAANNMQRAGRRRIRPDLVTVKLDQITSRQSHTNLDLSKHLHIPVADESGQIVWAPPPSSPPEVIVVDDSCPPEQPKEVIVIEDQDSSPQQALHISESALHKPAHDTTSDTPPSQALGQSSAAQEIVSPFVDDPMDSKQVDASHTEAPLAEDCQPSAQAKQLWEYLASKDVSMDEPKQTCDPDKHKDDQSAHEDDMLPQEQSNQETSPPPDTSTSSTAPVPVATVSTYFGRVIGTVSKFLGVS